MCRRADPADNKIFVITLPNPTEKHPDQLTVYYVRSDTLRNAVKALADEYYYHDFEQVQENFALKDVVYLDIGIVQPGYILDMEPRSEEDDE